MKKIITLSLSLLTLVGLVGCGESSDSSEKVSAGTSTTPASSEKVDANFDYSQNIIPVTRETNSGTREAFTEKIGIKEAAKDDTFLNGSVKKVASNGEVYKAVEDAPYAIGYGSLDSLTGNEKVHAVKINGVMPSVATVLDGTYSIQRPFNYALPKEQNLGATRSAIKWALSEAYITYLTKSNEGLDDIGGENGIITKEAENAAKDWVDVVKENKNSSWVTTLKIDETTGKSKLGTISAEDKFTTVGSTSVEKIVKASTLSFAKILGLGETAESVTNFNHTGSGDALTKLSNGTGDVGFASRAWKKEELTAFDTNYSGTMCLDAVAVIVNNANPAKDLTTQQVRDIYFKKEKVSSYTQGDYSKENQITTWEFLK